jgi:hypothetical protein
MTGHIDVTNMSHILRKSVFIFAFLFAALNAVANDQCTSKEVDWACFSMIEIQPEATAPTLRMVMFPNQELLAEIQQGGVTKRYLALRSGIQLYSGLSADESTSPGRKNPFAFLDLSFAVPITALRTAFPLGPSSVPDGESKRDILLQGKTITISTTRRGQQRIIYRLESASIHVSGLWERSVQSPLSGDFSLVGWTSPERASFATLEEARAAQTPH